MKKAILIILLLTSYQVSANSACQISDSVAQNLPDVKKEDFKEAFLAQLVKARYTTAKTTELLLNDPKHERLISELRDFDKENQKIITKVNNDKDWNRNSKPVRKQFLLKGLIGSRERLFESIGKIIDNKTVIPNILMRDKTEIRHIKMRDLIEDVRSLQKASREGVFQIPFSYEHYTDEGQEGALQWWFELGISFDKDGKLKIVDNGSSTAMALVGLCQSNKDIQTNRYYSSYKKGMEGICEDHSDEVESILLYEEDIDDYSLNTNFMTTKIDQKAVKKVEDYYDKESQLRSSCE